MIEKSVEVKSIDPKLFKFQTSDFKKHKELVESLLNKIDASIDAHSLVLTEGTLDKEIEAEVLGEYELLLDSVKTLIGPHHFSVLLGRFGATA